MEIFCMSFLKDQFHNIIVKQGLKAGIQPVKDLDVKREILGQLTWDIRIGIHTGPIIAGFSNGSFDIWGDAVNKAARLESSSETNKVQISEETRQFVETGADVTDRGFIELKNKGKMQTFFLNQLN
jgi:adenylate cyclase